MTDLTKVPLFVSLDRDTPDAARDLVRSRVQKILHELGYGDVDVDFDHYETARVSAGLHRDDDALLDGVRNKVSIAVLQTVQAYEQIRAEARSVAA